MPLERVDLQCVNDKGFTVLRTVYAYSWEEAQIKLLMKGYTPLTRDMWTAQELINKQKHLMYGNGK